MRRASTVVANSEFVLRSIHECAGNIRVKTCVIYNRAPRRTCDQSVAPWNDEMRHIVYVGQIAEHKGVRLLVATAKRLIAVYPDIVFHLVGGSMFSGELEKQLRTSVASEGLSDRIQFHGHVTDPQPYFRGAVVHVAPSLFEEPAANVVLEAKLAGIPSVVFPSGGLPELVNHERDGLVCREKTVDSLFDNISWFLDHESERVAQGSAALQDLHHRFGETRFAAEWAQTYHRVTATNRI